MTATLFSPIQLGDITLEHRIAMAPLTRFRAEDDHVPSPLAVKYYGQRSTAPGTLLITEATFISPQAGGYPNVPGIWSDAQIAGWKKLVDEVHSKGSKIYMQLWALGRAAAEGVLTPQGFRVVSASDIPLDPKVTPAALSADEIKQYVADYAQAAKNFVEGAGGDGVEIHGANGYLIDQFFQTTSNIRTDNYGGSVENRTRFGREVVDAVVAAVGAKKTGIRLSPYSTFQGMKMPFADIQETFSSFVTSIKASHPEMAYIHVVESRIVGNDDQPEPEGETLDFLYNIWTPSTFLVAGGFHPENAIKEAEKRKNTVVVFGRHFISNPDLVQRIQQNVTLTPYDRDTFYVYGPSNFTGYTDYAPATVAVSA